MATLVEGITKALEEFSCLYETPDGRQFVGNRVADVTSTMIGHGWKNVSRMDGYDFRMLGIPVVQGRYVAGARKKAFAREVAVLRWVD